LFSLTTPIADWAVALVLTIRAVTSRDAMVARLTFSQPSRNKSPRNVFETPAEEYRHCLAQCSIFTLRRWC
jgi:hypothetical protein